MKYEFYFPSAGIIAYKACVSLNIPSARLVARPIGPITMDV